MKNCLFTLVLALAALTVTAQQFDDCFDGRTLRLDYVFAGNHDAQQIYLEQMSVTRPSSTYSRRLCCCFLLKYCISSI